MKRFLFLLFLISSTPLWSYRINLAEQYYQLYHQHFYYYPDDIAENVHYLQMALHSDFANPLNALAIIENEKQWEKYRYLFYMHVNLELVDCFIKWAGKFDKFNAYFFNYPWKSANLDSLDNAEKLYKQALVYWDDALEWSTTASDDTFAWMYLTDIQSWEDENYRIQTGDLDYGEIIQAHLDRLEKVRQEFQAMGPESY
jgi:hypothetical protein